MWLSFIKMEGCPDFVSSFMNVLPNWNQILYPDRLNINPNTVDAEREYRHWKTMFKNFIKECLVETPNKLCCFIKYASAIIYELILDCTMYESAFNTLDKYLIKKKYKLPAPSLSYEMTNDDGKHGWVSAGATQVEFVKCYCWTISTGICLRHLHKQTYI